MLYWFSLKTQNYHSFQMENKKMAEAQDRLKNKIEVLKKDLILKNSE